MMFDAAGAATVIAERQQEGAEDPATPESPLPETVRHEVVVIDAAAANPDDLIAGLQAGTEVIVLDPSRDGLQQLVQALDGRQNVDALHIFSHGREGEVQLGDAVLSEQTLGGYQEALASLGRSLAPDGDILFYGCFVGRGPEGETLLRDLATATGADVAASSDATGNPGDDAGTIQGGLNWALEVRSGEIEARLGDVAGLGAGAGGASLPGFHGDFAANIAPTLSGGTVSLGVPDGTGFTPPTRISTLLGGLTVTDPDAGAVRGVAVVAANGVGSWQYSPDGVAWTSFGSVSDSSALLLTDTTSVRFAPSGDWGGNASLVFRAWDRTSGVASDINAPHFASTASTGGATAFSVGIAAARVTVSDGTPPAQPLDLAVTTTTAGAQSEAAVAGNAGGSFVTVWASSDGNGLGVFAQRFDARGVAQGNEFRVNTFTTGDQHNPTVAMSDAGSFVVAWESTGQEAGAGVGTTGVYAQRYSAAGQAQGGEFHVNTTVAGAQGAPAAAMSATGSFVITWTSGTVVSGQRYAASGAAQGGEFQVNSSGTALSSAVAMDRAGDFVVAWTGSDGTGTGIEARRYSAAGTALGASFVVNQTTAGTQQTPAIAMDAAGGFTVAWESNAQETTAFNLFARRYDETGAARGGEFQVNTTTPGSQSNAAVATSAAGEVLIAWQDTNAADGAGSGVFARRFNAAGTASGAQFQINSVTAGDQTLPALAMDAAGDAVAVWASMGQDGSNDGVFAHRYDAAGTVAEVLDLDGDGSSGATGTGFRQGFTTGESPKTIIDTDALLSGALSGFLTGATVTFSANFEAGADVLAFTAQNGITGAWDGASGTLTLQGSATASNYLAALRSVTFQNTAASPSTLTRTLGVRLLDGTRTSNTALVTLAVGAAGTIPGASDPVSAGGAAFGGGGAASPPPPQTAAGGAGTDTLRPEQSPSSPPPPPPLSPSPPPPPLFGGGVGAFALEREGGQQGLGGPPDLGLGRGFDPFSDVQGSGPGRGAPPPPLAREALAAVRSAVTDSAAAVSATPSSVSDVVVSATRIANTATEGTATAFSIESIASFSRSTSSAATTDAASGLRALAGALSLSDPGQVAALSGRDIADALRISGAPELRSAGAVLEALMAQQQLRSREDVQRDLGGLRLSGANREALMFAVSKVQSEIKHTLFQTAIRRIEGGGLADPFDLASVEDVASALPPLVRDNLAILIGVEDYGGVLPTLATPLRDVNEIGRALEADFGFQSLVLRNPSQHQIIATLQAVSHKMTPGQSLIIYYAGHGYEVSETRTGYWLPADAATDNPANWISTADISRFLGKVSARQTLLVSDSCYSGSFTRESQFAGERGGEGTEQAAVGRAVVVMSSGGDEPVRDDGTRGHSVFAAHMLEEIRGMQQPKAGFQVFAGIKDGVSLVTAQSPQYGTLPSAGHAPGADFVFNPRP